MFILVLNQNNIVQDGLNNKLVYKFPNSIKLTDKYIAVSSISMFYSWFNITQAQGNNIIYFQWDSSNPATIYQIVIPDGLYEISDLNHYFQFWMISKGFYYEGVNGSNIYMFELLINATRYSVQLNTYKNYWTGNPIPPAIGVTPVGFGDGTGYPTVECNPIITFPANFNIIVGYAPGFVSSPNSIATPYVASPNSAINGAGTISYLSTLAPQVQPNNNILFSLSNINSPYSQPSSIIYSINPSVLVGEQITDVPPNFLWVKLVDGTYSQLTLTLFGNNLQPIIIQDPNMTILLAIRDKDETSFGAK